MRASVFELQSAVVEREREIEALKTERAAMLDAHKRQTMDQVTRVLQGGGWGGGGGGGGGLWGDCCPWLAQHGGVNRHGAHQARLCLRPLPPP